jgi:hypothetical protein
MSSETKRIFYLFYAAPGMRKYAGYEANDLMLDQELTASGLSLTVDNLKKVFTKIEKRLAGYETPEQIAARLSNPPAAPKPVAEVVVSAEPWGILTSDRVEKMSGAEMIKWTRHSDPEVRQRFKDQVDALQISESKIHSASNKMDPKRSAPIL